MKCYASDYCQKDKSSCSDVCGGYRVLRALYNLSRIPERYRYTIALKPENGEDLEAFTVLDNYKNDVLNMVDEGRGLYIWGKSTGNGKTSWACKIMSYFFRKIAFNTGLENEGLYIFLPTFLEDLRDTEKELYNRLISICGDDNFSVNPDYKNYFLEIITHLGIEGAFDTISSILQDMIPCNLVLDLKNTLEERNTTPFSVAVVSCVAMRYQITNDINPKVATESPMYYGVGLGRAGTHIITHDIKSTVNKSSDLNVAQALSTGGSSGAITMDIAVKDEVESPHYEGVGVGMAFTKIITHDINSKATNSGNTTVASPVNTATVITIN